MKRLVKYSRMIAVTVGIISGLIIPAAVAVAQGNGNPNPKVLPPNSNPYGESYGEWSVAWLQWVLSLPVSANPNFDTTGALANNGQSGPVFFLPGTFSSGVIERTFTVPAGKALFAGIVGAFWDNQCPPINPPLSVEELRALAASVIPAVTEMHASLDGVPLHSLTSYRAISPVFSYTLPPSDNVCQHFGFDVSDTVYPAVSDGYFLLFAPLPVGRHDIVIGASAGDPFNLSFEIRYHITVGP